MRQRDSSVFASARKPVRSVVEWVEVGGTCWLVVGECYVVCVLVWKGVDGQYVCMHVKCLLSLYDDMQFETSGVPVFSLLEHCRVFLFSCWHNACTRTFRSLS